MRDDDGYFTDEIGDENEADYIGAYYIELFIWLHR